MSYGRTPECEPNGPGLIAEAERKLSVAFLKNEKVNGKSPIKDENWPSSSWDSCSSWARIVEPNCEHNLTREKWPSLISIKQALEQEDICSTSYGVPREGRVEEYWRRNITKKELPRWPPISSVSSNMNDVSAHNKRSRTAATSVGAAQAEKSTGNNNSKLVAPVLLMLNTDFIVSSPLKENLLLTLALTQKRIRSPSPDADEAEALSSTGGTEELGNKRRQVLVGRFEALSSFVRFGLGRDALRVATESNAGGTSTISESLSVEYFVRRFQAKDVVTEMEVEYCSMNWKKVDYICNLYGRRVGVSVTRAMSYPNPLDFSPQMAYRLLHKKLFGLVVARHGVTERHSFSQCILHVWCETRTTAKILEAQYRDVSEELDITEDVIMVLTVADGGQARPIFYESCLERFRYLT